MKKLLIILCLVFFSGCQQVVQEDQSKPTTYTYITKVISEPPGARIEVDNDYIGDAPLEIKWDELSSKEEIHTVKAFPIYENNLVQFKVFFHRSIPKTIFFDMRLGPIPKQYEIDID